MIKTWKEWRESLSAKSLEAFEDVCWSPEERLSANEILDHVVRYQGGVATGAEIRVLVAEIYGISLRDL